MDKCTRWQLLCLSLSALAWLTSGYLLLRLLRLGQGATVGTDVCSALGGGCDWTLMSPASWQLGLPLPAWGLLYFSLVAFLLVLASPTLIRITVFLAAGGIGASIVLSFLLFQSHIAVCHLCLFFHLLNISLFTCLLALDRSVNARPATNEVPTLAPSKPALLGLIFACFLGVLGQGILLWLPESIDRETVLAKYLESPKSDLVVAEDDPTFGPDDATVRLVVFNSFQCPGCRQFVSYQKYLEARFGRELQVVFKHFPLSSECNESVRRILQPEACAAAHAAEAARKQNAFHRYHDRLFSVDLGTQAADLRGIAQATDLDIARWDADRQSAAVKDKIRRDTEVGSQLGINETPSIFLNGRRVRPYNLDILVFLIDHELKLVASNAIE